MLPRLWQGSKALYNSSTDNILIIIAQILWSYFAENGEICSKKLKDEVEKEPSKLSKNIQTPRSLFDPIIHYTSKKTQEGFTFYLKKKKHFDQFWCYPFYWSD